VSGVVILWCDDIRSLGMLSESDLLISAFTFCSAPIINCPTNILHNKDCKNMLWAMPNNDIHYLHHPHHHHQTFTITNSYYPNKLN